MRKIINLLFVIFLTSISIIKVNAVTLEENEITLNQGESKTIQLTENFKEKVNKIEFNLVYYTNDITGNFSVNSSYQDKVSGVKHEITFPNGVSGEINLGEIKVVVSNKSTVEDGNINISNVRATTMNGKILTLTNESLKVTIDDSKEKKDVVEKNLIEKIESNIVQITLKENTYEYKVIVKDDIDELDLKPIAKSKDTNIDISSQKLEKGKRNVITIKANKDGVEEEYKINVEIQDEIKIDKTEYKQDDSYKNKWLIIMAIFGMGLIIGVFLLKRGK